MVRRYLPWDALLRQDDLVAMLRILGCFGLGIIFLIISPALRESIVQGMDSGLHGLEFYSPWSYVGVALCMLLGAMAFIYRAAQPR